MESTFQPILHVEDDDNDVLLFQRGLAGAGVVHPIQVVRNGMRAIDYLLGRPPFDRRELYPLPSLILLDLSTPMLGGIAVLKWRQTHEGVRRIPAVVLTSSQHPEDVIAAYDSGANGYLVKPLNFDGWVEMARAIRNYWFMHNTFAPSDAPTPVPVTARPPATGEATPAWLVVDGEPSGGFEKATRRAADRLA